MPDGETVLMTAARTGKVDVLKLLIARGADIRAHEPSKGQTALMWAAAENNAAAVKLLVEAGADLHERSRGGSFTPLLFAVRAGHIEASKALLDLGAKIEDALPDGTSALVLATINAHYELAGFLLDRGANPSAAAQGWTALASDRMVSTAQCRFQSSRSRGYGGPRQSGTRTQAREARRERQRASDEGTSGRQSESAESYRCDAISARRKIRGRSAAARVAGVRRGSLDQDQQQHDAAYGCGRCRHLGPRRESGHA